MTLLLLLAVWLVMLLFGWALLTGGTRRPDPEPAPVCGCWTCDESARKARLDAGGSFSEYISRFMIVCPDCGNKRCPKSTHHDNPCSGSNDPNQPGSRYAYIPLLPLAADDPRASGERPTAAHPPVQQSVKPNP